MEGRETQPRLVLVGCVKTKLGHAAMAKDLYDSALWRKRRCYAEAIGQPWAILSAEHGVVDPETVLEPYDRYLGNEPAEYRREWSQKVAEDLKKRLETLGLASVEVHAGAAYVTNGLRKHLDASGVRVVWPVAGLTFGAQLAWYQQC